MNNTELCVCFVFFQAEDGIRYLVRSRGLGDVYKRQIQAGGNVQNDVSHPRSLPPMRVIQSAAVNQTPYRQHHTASA